MACKCLSITYITEVSCGAPAVDGNTVQAGNATLFGDMIKFECASGYTRVNGSESIICQANRQWNDTSLLCERGSCGNPDTNANTSVATDTTVYEGVANYTCNAGYEQSGGNLRRVCGADGNWNGRALECQSK